MASKLDQSIERKLTTLRQIAMQSNVLKTRVDASLTDCLNDISNESSPQIVVQTAQSMIRVMAERSRMFGSDIFGDPAWDILLHLYTDHTAARMSSITNLCAAIIIPMTTAIRYLADLEKLGLVSRHKDKADARLKLIALTPRAVDGVERTIGQFRWVQR